MIFKKKENYHLYQVLRLECQALDLLKSKRCITIQLTRL
jgi:hypothetical protein